MTASRPIRLPDLHGVGPKLADKMKALGISQVADLLFHLPNRYEDRTRIHPIGSCQPGQRVLIEGRVEHSAIVRGRRAMLVVVLFDGTGRVTLRFFHFRAYQRQQLASGTRLRCFGEIRAGFKGLEMIHPGYKRLSDHQDEPVADRLTPIYPTAEGLGQKIWLRMTDQALALMRKGELELEELLPVELLKQLKLMPLAEALDYIHRPPPNADVAALALRDHPTQKRLALEELLAHNLSMQKLHRRQRARRAPAMPAVSGAENAFLHSLPFELTAAQKRVAREIGADLERATPMLRLVHGDVGSGKTVIAALAAMRAVDNGLQTAITAPTELLAEQHFQVFSKWLKPLGLDPVWLSGKVTGKRRSEALQRIRDGAEVVIGTHALMQKGVEFKSLGLVIVDEQHRFGVGQRMDLLEKGGTGGQQAHQMIMTATPIPRTLAMTAYAGMDVSVIDELPPGRKPVTTVVMSNERRGEVIRRVASACADNRQAYWVCTLIEETDAIEAQAAEDVARHLSDDLQGLAIGLIHGRMKPTDKQQVMDAFKAGDIHLLVATTVIEVGVDVPNASLMIIENAERLGLAQLHQLRGRVGRGSSQSSCVLMYNPPLGELARQRMEIMRQTADGFQIAEKDLELRGPGEVLGTRQTGMLLFRVADLARDAGLLKIIPSAADALLREHPGQVDKLIRRWVGDASRFAGV
ncbi:MAG: ATP-dependent DNA helicase RecG [Gammaproteobacteria bacterium]|nr:ATP-dependent DNA helicase RecG [Gammaproteobacteria bacterium]